MVARYGRILLSKVMCLDGFFHTIQNLSPVAPTTPNPSSPLGHSP